MGLKGRLDFAKKERSKLMKLLKAVKLTLAKDHLKNFASAFLYYEHADGPNRDAHYFFYENEIKEDPKKLKRYEQKYHAKIDFKYLLVYRKDIMNLEVIFNQGNKMTEFGGYFKQSRPSR